jgi:hypothetical protein
MIDILKITLITVIIATLIREKKTPLSWYGKLIKRLPWYLKKPIGGCYLCFTGEVCLWTYIFTKPFNLSYQYFFELLFFVSAGIFMSAVYNKIYCFLRND